MFFILVFPFLISDHFCLKYVIYFIASHVCFTLIFFFVKYFPIEKFRFLLEIYMNKNVGDFLNYLIFYLGNFFNYIPKFSYFYEIVHTTNKNISNDWYNYIILLLCISKIVFQVSFYFLN